MLEQQECIRFDFNSIPGYRRLTQLERELDGIEEIYDKLTSEQLQDAPILIQSIDELRQKIKELKHPILEFKTGRIEETELDELEREIRQLQSKVTSLKRTKYG